MSIKVILFDLNTFINTDEYKYKLFQHTLYTKGLPTISYTKYCAKYAGIPTTLMMRLHLPHQSQQFYTELQDLMRNSIPTIINQLTSIHSNQQNLFHSLANNWYWYTKWDSK